MVVVLCVHEMKSFVFVPVYVCVVLVAHAVSQVIRVRLSGDPMTPIRDQK